MFSNIKILESQNKILKKMTNCKIFNLLKYTKVAPVGGDAWCE